MRWFKKKKEEEDGEGEKEKDGRVGTEKGRKAQGSGSEREKAGKKKVATTTSKGKDKKEGKLGEIEAVVFVPYSPNSGLAKQLQGVEDNYIRMSGKGRLRVVD